MLEAVKVALDPTPRQSAALASNAGAARFAYNAGLAYVKEALDNGEHVDWSHYGLRKWWNSEKRELAPWWAENSKESYSYGLKSLAKALKAFSDSKRGKRHGRRVGFPKFKAKGRSDQRFAYTTGSFGLINKDPKALRLPKIGRVHCMEDVARRVGEDKVLRMSVSCHAGRWYASLTVEREDVPTRSRHRLPPVGIDLGVKELATFSDGTVFHNPRSLANSERKLAKAQRSLARKTPGSNRRKRQKARVAKLYSHVSNQRVDAMEKLTTHISRTYSDVSIEDLNVAGMVRNHSLAKAVEDASFGEFRRQLEYKCAREGVPLHVIDRFYPSSKTCSACGSVRAKLSLSERTFVCPECGTVLDRDLNAAINIMVAGSAPETLNARGADVRPGHHLMAGQTAVRREPSGRLGGASLGAIDSNGNLQTSAN